MQDYIKVFGIDVISVIDNITMSDIKSIPEICGVYLIEYCSGHDYAGSSKNLNTRLYQWSVDKHMDDKIKSVKIYQTRDIIDALTLESIFIHGTSPYLNRKHNNKNIFRYKESGSNLIIEKSDSKTGEVYIKLSSIVTGFYEGNAVHIDVIDSGIVVLTRMHSLSNSTKKESIKDEPKKEFKKKIFVIRRKE